MAKTGCEHCKLANMVDDLKRHPSMSIVRAARVKLDTIKRYAKADKTCPVHADRQYRGSALVMEHWTNRIANKLERGHAHGV